MLFLSCVSLRFCPGSFLLGVRAFRLSCLAFLRSPFRFFFWWCLLLFFIFALPVLWSFVGIFGFRGGYFPFCGLPGVFPFVIFSAPPRYVIFHSFYVLFPCGHLLFILVRKVRIILYGCGCSLLRPYNYPPSLYIFPFCTL